MAASVVAGSAYGQTQEVRRGPVPTWVSKSELMPTPASAGGAVFVRRQDVQIQLSAAGQAQYLGYRVKLLHSSALPMGNISITWNPRSGAPIVHGITVVREGQETDVLKTVSFEILRRENQLEAAMLDGNLTAVLRVPDLRVGDELEVEVTTFTSDPTLGGNDAGMIFLGSTPTPGRYRIGLSWDTGHKPNVRMSNDITTVAVVGERTVDLRFDNPPTVSPPKDAPARYRWQRALEYSEFADWPAVSRHFAPLYAKAATLDANSALRREAARIAAANATPLARASAALKLVQQDVRYIYVGLNAGNLTPSTADETWRRRYGDCKAKTVLLLALLTELSIEAEPVLVNSSGADDGLDERLPVPQYFDHVLVRARIDGMTYWLDGTLPPVASPAEQPILPLKWVLPLTMRGDGLAKLEWRPPKSPDEIKLTEIDASAGFDKPARKVSTSIVRGLKGLQEQARFSAVTPAQLKDAFQQRGIGDTWQTIDDVQWRYDPSAGASILTISGTGMVDWDDDGGGARSLALPGGGFSPPERRLRPAGENQDAPYYTKPEYSCHVTTVRLPTSTESKHWSSKASFDQRMFGRNYYRAWELRDGAIRMVRGSRVEQPEIDAATARRDNSRIPSFDNSMGWISYRPKGQSGPVGDGEMVPATYELDWTAAEVPCLSPATRGKQ